MNRRNALLIFGAALLASLSSGACSDSATEPALPTTLTSALQECGIVSEGKIGWWEGWIFDTCEAECVGEEMCNGLEEYFCQGAWDHLDNCLAVCYGNEDSGDNDSSFTCGDGEVIYGWEQCDGYSDCTDGADEQSCPTFACDDGSQVLEDAKCDGWMDCADGSDEVNCPIYECDDGTPMSRHAWCDTIMDCEDNADERTCFPCDGALVSACDNVPECADGSDEMNCFACENGDLISSYRECDFDVNCPDGSDEHDGCAQFLCEIGW